MKEEEKTGIERNDRLVEEFKAGLKGVKQLDEKTLQFLYEWIESFWSSLLAFELVKFAGRYAPR